MILDVLENAHRYLDLHRDFAQALEFLRRPDLPQLAAQRHSIAGERIFAIVDKAPGRDAHNARLEAHRRYIDIQMVLAGTDTMGWRPTSLCEHPVGPYDADKDIRFFTDQPSVWVSVPPATFAIFFPDDAHMPLIGSSPIHKVVVKIAV